MAQFFTPNTSRETVSGSGLIDHLLVSNHSFVHVDTSPSRSYIDLNVTGSSTVRRAQFFSDHNPVVMHFQLTTVPPTPPPAPAPAPGPTPSPSPEPTPDEPDPNPEPSPFPPAPAPAPSSGASKAVVAGATVSGLVAVAAMIAIAFFVIRRRRRRGTAQPSRGLPGATRLHDLDMAAAPHSTSAVPVQYVSASTNKPRTVNSAQPEGMASGYPAYGQAASNRPAASSFTANAVYAPMTNSDSALYSNLPAGWQAFTDDTSGSVYYYHAASGSTQWEAPVR